MKKKGTTVECWRDYAATLPPTSRHVNRARKDVIEFFRLRPPTMQRLLSGQNSLLGLSKVKAQVFLQFKGYLVTEIAELPDIVRSISEVLAYELVDSVSLANGLQYKHTNSLFRLLSGETKEIPQYRLSMMEEVVAMYEAELTEARTKWKTQLTPTQVEKEEVRSAPIAPPVRTAAPTVKRSVPTSEDEVMFVGLALAMQPIAERLLANANTAADRKRIRDSIGSTALFALSTNLNRLGSEAANKQYAGRTSDPRNQQ